MATPGDAVRQRAIRGAAERQATMRDIRSHAGASAIVINAHSKGSDNPFFIV
jgi:hypothetical protein